MFRPASIFIGLRYIRAKRRNQFVSLISLISMLGIALGVIVLITVLSVLNGFDREIKKQIFGMISPITISNYTGKIENWQNLEKNLQMFPDIIASAPSISGQALLTHSSMTQPALVTGIIPSKEKRISVLAEKMIKGKLETLSAGSFNIVLGEDLANHLSVTVGDTITVATPQASFSLNHFSPHFQQFTVTGIFHAGGGGFNFDDKFSFIHLSDAQKLFNMGSAITALHVNIKNIYAAPKISQLLQNELSPTIYVGNWTQQLGDFFENIRITKTIMFFIFILIIAVAVINLIGTMIMVVKNKQSDIAILRTYGATPKMILAIFIVQGAAIGVGGTLLGLLGGITLALNVTTVTNWIQHVLNVKQ